MIDRICKIKTAVAFDLDIRVDKRNAHFSARMGMNG
jgi:hypothetical protein